MARERDPYRYPRTWLKRWTRRLDDPEYFTLSSTEQGVLDKIEMYSLTQSRHPGHFLHRDDPASRPMDIRDIAVGIRTPAEEVEGAFAVLKRHGFLKYAADVGWSLPRWPEEQSRDISESRDETAKRAADRRRRLADEGRQGKIVRPQFDRAEGGE